MVLKRVSEAGGRGAGGFVGGILNNPGTVAILAIVAALVIFRGDIRTFFGTTIPEAISGIGSVELPDITLPEINFPEITFPEFPDITFPDFPDFTSIFEDFFAQFGGGPPPEPVPIPPGPVAPPGTPPGPGTTTEFPPGCTFDPVTGIIDCPEGGPTFDACAEFPDLPQCQPQEEPIIPPITPPTPPGPELPPGFVGGGPSFEGGIIFETNDCFLSLNQLINKYGISASQAADIKAQACTAEPGFQPTDIPEEFDPGTSTGSGIFGPPTGEEQIVIGGATLESEEKKAACTSCELFGLNCPICMGAVNFG